MDTKTAFRNLKKGRFIDAIYWFLGTLMIFFPLLSIAGDSLPKPDSLANDTLNAAKKSIDISSVEDNPFLKYSLIALLIVVVVAVALIPSLRKSKPNPPIGYRKNPNRPNPKVKL